MSLGSLLGDPAQGRLTEFLRRQYPELERLEILELDELVESWETDLFRLKLAGKQNGALETVELVLRLYKGNDPIEKAQKELGWEPEVSYEEGIRRTVQWYLAQEAKEAAQA